MSDDYDCVGGREKSQVIRDNNFQSRGTGSRCGRKTVEGGTRGRELGN